MIDRKLELKLVHFPPGEAAEVALGAQKFCSFLIGQPRVYTVQPWSVLYFISLRYLEPVGLAKIAENRIISISSSFQEWILELFIIIIILF